MIPKKRLECSSAGDQDFSAHFAWVEVFGLKKPIEYHYQMSKMFDLGYNRKVNSHVIGPMKTTKLAKGRKPVKVKVGDFVLPVRFLSQWYKLLWLKYLDENPELVAYASQFDEFTDKFRGKSVNCQADVIRQYVKEGRESIIRDCEELWTLLKMKQQDEAELKEKMDRFEAGIDDTLDDVYSFQGRIL